MDYKTNLFLYFLGAFAGGVGGTGTVMFHITRSKHVPAIQILAYVVIGFTIGLITAAWLLAMSTFESLPVAMNAVVAWSGGAGLLATLTLVFVQQASKLVLKWQGIEVQLTLREQDEERRTAAAREADK